MSDPAHNSAHRKAPHLASLLAGGLLDEARGWALVHQGYMAGTITVERA